LEKYVLILCACVLILSSCGDVSSHSKVIVGNYQYAFGNYEDANMAYLHVAQREEYEDVLQYNLGNVYHAVGEAGSALLAYETAMQTEDPELLYRVVFNQGILRYEMGDYSEAFILFRKALELRPSSMNAKVNLEYTLLKMNPEQPAGQPRQQKPESGRERDETDAGRILDYIQRKEERRWISTEKIPPDAKAQNW
jgi:Ca-activated chloride channel family protein